MSIEHNFATYTIILINLSLGLKVYVYPQQVSGVILNYMYNVNAEKIGGVLFEAPFISLLMHLFGKVSDIFTSICPVKLVLYNLN